LRHRFQRGTEQTPTLEMPLTTIKTTPRSTRSIDRQTTSTCRDGHRPNPWNLLITNEPQPN
jgi:hypothetical protein